MKSITAIVLGAGQRGANVYAAYALSFPNELKIVGVAEPRADRRAAFAREHGIPEGRCFAGWEDALRQDKFADCVFVCTQDRMHFEPVMQALEKGYDVLCEKPMSYDRTELIAMGEKARQTGRVLSICHVLRYSPFFVKLKELIDSGAIGQLVLPRHGHPDMACRQLVCGGQQLWLPCAFQRRAQAGRCDGILSGWVYTPGSLPVLRAALLSGASKGRFRWICLCGEPGSFP